MGSSTQVSLGALNPPSNSGGYNKVRFVIQSLLSKMQTATIVEVVAVTNDGDTSPVGFVDVVPQVNQLDGSIPANSTPHGTIHGLPYLRIQGGNNAIIMDPQVGDLGIAIFASRDISNVKTTKAQANPGSYRQYNFADGMYVGGLLNGSPQQYLQFNDDGITLLSPTAIALQGANITAGSGGITKPVVTMDFYNWVINTMIPTLLTHGITFALQPPLTSITTVFEAE